jgi:hypothetical protein
VILSQKALFLNADTGVHTAATLRRSIDSLVAPGVQDLNSFKVRQRVAGAAMSVDVTDAATLSQAYIRGASTNLQGVYYVTNSNPTTGTIDALYNVDIAAADPANPRIDQVYLTIEDAQHAGANNQATIRVVTGTATGGATLDNLTGVGAAPASMSSELLADVLVPAASVTVVTANIRDRRRVGNFGTVPWLGSTGTQVDMVAFEPHPGTPVVVVGGAGGAGGVTATTHDSMQSAALMWLPRRINGVTKLRWKYQQGATAAATNYTIFICDASGRQLLSTGAVAFTGALNTTTEVSATLTVSNWESGWYYVGIGVAPMTASSVVYYNGVVGGVATGNNLLGAPYRNVVLRSATGGSTPPTTILSFTDTAGLSGTTAVPPVPIVALSVT